MSSVTIEIIAGNRVIKLTLEDVEEMEVRQTNPSPLLQSTEVTIRCEKVTNMPRIRNRR